MVGDNSVHIVSAIDQTHYVPRKEGRRWMLKVRRGVEMLTPWFFVQAALYTFDLRVDGPAIGFRFGWGRKAEGNPVWRHIIDRMRPA